MIKPIPRSKLMQLINIAKSPKYLNIEDDRTANCDWRRKIVEFGAKPDDSGVPSLKTLSNSQLDVLYKQLTLRDMERRSRGRVVRDKASFWRL